MALDHTGRHVLTVASHRQEVGASGCNHISLLKYLRESTAHSQHCTCMGRGGKVVSSRGMPDRGYRAAEKPHKQRNFFLPFSAISKTSRSNFMLSTALPLLSASVHNRRLTGPCHDSHSSSRISISTSSHMMSVRSEINSGGSIDPLEPGLQGESKLRHHISL